MYKKGEMHVQSCLLIKPIVFVFVFFNVLVAVASFDSQRYQISIEFPHLTTIPLSSAT